MDAAEPLRSRLRVSSLDVLKDMHSLSQEARFGEASARLSSLSGRVTELSALLDIALISRMISEGNGSVLKRELGTLSEMLGTISASVEKSVFIPEKFFSDIPQLSFTATVPLDKGQNKKDVLYKKMSFKPERTASKGTKIKDVNGNGNGREETILRLIKSGGILSIREVHAHFEGVSEKTIQRELTRLVGKGVLERKGDKRWSRYSIAS